MIIRSQASTPGVPKNEPQFSFLSVPLNSPIFIFDHDSLFIHPFIPLSINILFLYHFIHFFGFTPHLQLGIFIGQKEYLERKLLKNLSIIQTRYSFLELFKKFTNHSQAMKHYQISGPHIMRMNPLPEQKLYHQCMREDLWRELCVDYKCYK